MIDRTQSVSPSRASPTTWNSQRKNSRGLLRLATMHGEISSEWWRCGRSFDRRIRVPANTRATVWIPSAPGRPLETDGLELLRREPEFAVCEAAAGAYHLVSEEEI